MNLYEDISTTTTNGLPATTDAANEEVQPQEKIKRIRRSKKQMHIQEDNIAVVSSTLEEAQPTVVNNEMVPEKIYKKRGRKPKGGKIIVNNVQPEKVINPPQNIILHLKCKSTDQIQPDFLSSLTYNPEINQVETFQFGNEIGYAIIQSNDNNYNTNDKEYNIENTMNNTMIMSNTMNNTMTNTMTNTMNINTMNNTMTNTMTNTMNINTMNNTMIINNMVKNNNDKSSTVNPHVYSSINPVVYHQLQSKEPMKESGIINDSFSKHLNENDEMFARPNEDIKNIAAKLKELTANLHLNNISYKKSACFWCTCDFDNPPIYIPKYEIGGIYHCYGCFCSPECSTAYLFNEHIDTATRFERYHLINHIYCKIYNYMKNVKPAPNPFYLLNKYYGNLTIQEYRQLLKNERLLIVVDKPLTRTLPELHEDNDDFMFNGKTIPSSTNKFKLKRKNKPTN
jgi:hypothetical protein